MKSAESKEKRDERKKKKDRSDVHLAEERQRERSLLWKGGHFLVGLCARRNVSLSLFRNETKSSSNIYGELRVERANSRSDVDTYVRFHLRRRWSAMSSSSDSLIVCSSARINQKDAEPGAAGTRVAAPLSGDRCNGKYL